MIYPWIKIKRKQPQLESIGILLFTVCIWMYSIFPLFTSHPFFCFTILSMSAVVYLTLCRFRRESGFYVYRATLIWTVFMISLFFSSINNISIYTCATLLAYAAGIVFIIFCCHTTSQYDIGISILKILAAIYILSIFLQYFSTDLFEQLFLDRFDSLALSYYESSTKKYYVIGLGGSPGVATVNCTIALAILVSFNRRNNYRENMVKLPYLIVIFTAFILIGKKSGLLSAFFSLAIIYLMASGDKIWRKITLIFISILLFGGVMYLFTRIFSSTYLSLKIREGFNQLIEGRDFSSGRFHLYKSAWQEFLRHPLFGIGWTGFSSKYGNLAHNIYLQLLCETGIIGFFLFVIPAFSVYFRSCKLVLKLNGDNSAKGIINYMIFSLYIQSEFLFISLFENNLYMIMPLYLYFFACGIAFTAEREFNSMHYRKKGVRLKYEAG